MLGLYYKDYLGCNINNDYLFGNQDFSAYRSERVRSYLTADQFLAMLVEQMCVMHIGLHHILLNSAELIFAIQCMIIAHTIDFGSKKNVSNGCLP